MSKQCNNPLNNPNCKGIVKTDTSMHCMSCGKYGIKLTDIHKNNISKSKIGKVGGENNPMYGKTHTDDTRKLMSENHTDISSENNSRYGKTYEEIHGIDKSMEIKEKLKIANLNKPRSIESRKKQANTIIQKKYNISYDEYLDTLSDRDRYYKLVSDITKQQPIHLLENYDKRGRADIDDEAYHLDHKISISYGFYSNIPPEKIGDISNLRFIYWKENIIKQGENYYE